MCSTDLFGWHLDHRIGSVSTGSVLIGQLGLAKINPWPSVVSTYMGWGRAWLLAVSCSKCVRSLVDSSTRTVLGNLKRLMSQSLSWVKNPHGPRKLCVPASLRKQYCFLSTRDHKDLGALQVIVYLSVTNVHIAVRKAFFGSIISFPGSHPRVANGSKTLKMYVWQPQT